MRRCLVWLALCCTVANAQMVLRPDFKSDIRYCGTPARNADGSIKRSTAVINAFKRLHPCPSTGLTFGACPGWAIDHIIPLACGGCDAVWNMQWLPNEIKSSSNPKAKDRWERKINAGESCTFQIIE